MILEGKSTITTTKKRDRETERAGERDKDRREKLMVGRLSKDFMKEMARSGNLKNEQGLD